ncbi:MAG: U32 family peptidase [Clostridiales bacterium]|nr:U32 family peptidase [Clostridiales bacterium]
MNTELLAPAGNREKLETALYFGADAVYLAGKAFGLRAYCDNFTDDQLSDAVAYCHARGKKVYVTLNVYAFDADLRHIKEYARFLAGAGADGVIVSDPGVIACLREYVPELPVHLSTQANTTNGAAARFWAKQGVSRIVLAREVSIENIKRIRDALPDEVELEAFVHGAMCVAYSGRCLLSAATTGRSGNRGACAQSCRWEYALMEKTREGEYFPVSEDGRGTYILNSKDLNMLPYLDKLIEAGVTSLKIEGRAKTAYYLATVVNAYRRALDLYEKEPAQFSLPADLASEPYKTSHRAFHTGFYFGNAEQYLLSAKPEQTYEMCAIVRGMQNGVAQIEQRNRFAAGDIVEVLSPTQAYGKTFAMPALGDGDGNEVTDAKNVQQMLYMPTVLPLAAGDILRRKTL